VVALEDKDGLILSVLLLEKGSPLEAVKGILGVGLPAEEGGQVIRVFYFVFKDLDRMLFFDAHLFLCHLLPVDLAHAFHDFGGEPVEAECVFLHLLEGALRVEALERNS